MKSLALLGFAMILGVTTTVAQTNNEASKEVAFKGCLVRGDEPKEVWLAAKDGTIYALESSTIDLNQHLGQKVIVRGYVLHEGRDAIDKKQEENKTSRTENADLRVLTLKLKMISTTCSK